MRRIFTNKILLGVLCIAIGMVPLLTLINTVGSGKAMLAKEFNSDGNKLISIKFEGAEVDYSDLRTLRQEMPEIKDMIPIAKTMAPVSSYKSNGTVELKAVSNDYWRFSGLNITKGKFISKGQIDNSQNVAVIDDLTADKLFGTTDVLGRSIKLSFNGTEMETVIVGVCKRMDISKEKLDEEQGIAFIPITLLDNNSSSYRIDEALFSVNLHIEEAKARISHYFAINGIDESQFEVSFVNQVNIINSFLDRNFYTFLAAGLLWFFAAVLGLINIMLVDIEKSKRYYGLLKFYGNTDKQIRKIIFANALIIGLASSIFSIVIGLAVSFAICSVLNIPLFVSIHTLTIGILIPGIVCLAAAVYPAIRAARIDMNKVIWQFD